ncbi:hypothetical protein M1D34_19045 [Ensifer sp. D2-11]|jgi:hypothetical protein
MYSPLLMGDLLTDMKRLNAAESPAADLTETLCYLFLLMLLFDFLE